MNHYRLLGAAKSSTDEEIRVAYGKLAKNTHPDLFDNDAKKAATMADLNVAYNVLKDKKKRMAYDRQLMLRFSKCLACNGKGCTSKQKGFSKKVSVLCTACGGGGYMGG